MEIVAFINAIVAEIGKPKFTFEKAAVNHELLDDLMAYGLPQIEYALGHPRQERPGGAPGRRPAGLCQEKFERQARGLSTPHIEVCLYKMQKKVVKKWLLAGQARGRPPHRRDPSSGLPRSAFCPESTAPACSPAVRPRCCPSAP